MTRNPRLVYLVRHAIAAERGRKWPDDDKRPLTAKGIARMMEIAVGLRSLDVRIDVVVTSPLVRARQTADLLAEALRPVPPIGVTAALSPGVPPARMARAFAGYKKSQGIALVGHEPNLGAFAAWLLDARSPLPFKKGGICCIALPRTSPAGRGQLLWMATPQMLRALAK